MIKRRNYIWLVPLSLIVTFPVWRIPVASFLTPRVTYEPPRTEDPKRQNFKMETVRILQNKNGKISAEIRAERAFTTDNPDEYSLEIVDGDIYNTKGEVTNITARQGVFNGASQQLTLIDNVVIAKESDNQHLYTDLLYYDDTKKLVFCPNKVLIEGQDASITGTGLSHDIAKGTYDLGGRVFCNTQGSISP
ncbi:LPS export ABC transporter periplasmic protein LptC [Desulfopila aestuarii]|uniref:LPS export ABC transporter protein LptC n=1 Tax=Desulfopila aestuarii DSM 18488 TaxID=1121416 RepID=A0A1M7XW44_9BACT|nr:LPS export ABC transporter periplasmic protein LptC [Desulfopila aestuarii]SHO42923.1 LPS export ABC transporter protein LptC [Desulfopila aestuarii DSM 18488]